jgi:ribosomal protein S18 acetylase RimI-like enzyme
MEMELDISNLTYRKLYLQDLDLLVKYRMMFLRELQNPADKNDLKLLEESLIGYFSKTLEDNTFIAWVSEYENEPVSFGGMVVQDIPGHFTFISGKQGYILNMYTLPEYRGRGLSTKLLHKLIEDAKSAGLTKVYLHATNDGINIYKKAGFSASSWPVLEMKI